MRQRHSIAAAEALRLRAGCLADNLAGVARACIPFEPDSNLVCIALNPTGNRSAAVASDLVRALHDGLRSNPRQPLQARERSEERRVGKECVSTFRSRGSALP